MKKALRKILKLYSRVIMNFNGIFIFVGILAVVFGDYGWFPNKDIYAISQFVYWCVIPIMIAYALGNHRKGLNEGQEYESLRSGGAIAVMATAGMIMADKGSGIFGAMILGPLCSFMWEYFLMPLLGRVRSGMEMLLRNMTVAIAGAVCAVFSYYILAPALSTVVSAVFWGTDYLVKHNLVFLLNVLIEPGKVFFLNNIMNHGVLIPLGMQQVNEHGSSILFLLESNPGPGIGVLLALYFRNQKKRTQYATSMFTQFIGGVHEVYFPEVLSRPWLIAALIGGGVSGTLCFSLLKVEALVPVSPGSILTLMLVTEKGRFFTVLLGVGISAAVTFVLSLLILKEKRETGKKDAERENAEKENTEREGSHLGVYKIEDMPERAKKVSKEATAGAHKIEDMCDGTEVRSNAEVKKIGVICDGGVGSSAMGAALLRRKLRERNVTEIEVNAYAGDQVPADLDIGICQKDFQKITKFELEGIPLYEVESLMNQSEYESIIEEIMKRKGGIL